MMKNYELTCLVSPNLLDIELQSFQEKVILILQKERGILIGEIQQKPAKKRLGYPIKNFSQAYLIDFNFQMPPEGLEKMKKELKPLPDLIRFGILIKKPSGKIKKRERLPRTRKKTSQPKVELQQIEKKLKEILGE